MLLAVLISAGEGEHWGRTGDLFAAEVLAGLSRNQCHLIESGLKRHFSRYPIHRLARKEAVDIAIQQQSENGEPDFKWEVTYVQKYGQPGPLAYKVDTLIVNRRIDEAGRPLPGIIKLGSLTQLCMDLGYKRQRREPPGRPQGTASERQRLHHCPRPLSYQDWQMAVAGNRLQPVLGGLHRRCNAGWLPG